MDSGPAEILLRLLADAELRHDLARSQGEFSPAEGARAGHGGRPAGWAQLASAAVVGDLDDALAAWGLTAEVSGFGPGVGGWPLLTPGPATGQAPSQAVSG